MPSINGPASSNRMRPWLVRFNPRPWRSNNATPSSLSNAPNCRLTAGWLRYSASAARVTEPNRAAWQNARNCLSLLPL